MTTHVKARPVPLGLEPSFGFGDRLGLATPGHLEALRAEGGPIRGIFAQQSIREMDRTRRGPTQVMNAAIQGLEAGQFDQAWGADADHLKTPADVDRIADAGFVFYTIDPSDHVDPQAASYDADALRAKFEAVQHHAPWASAYLGETVCVPDGPTICFDDRTVQRAAVKYAKAIKHALELAAYIKQAADQRQQDYEIELSVDETPQPTTLAEHYIIADQCRQGHMKLVSLAPRYIGDFEKGVDYKGDLDALEQSLGHHAAIAQDLGPYKLSLHSGSDKLSMYGLFARATQGQFHVKTAGTSYLEALRVVARHDESLFRRIIDFARIRYDTDKATYHVSAGVEDVPAPAQVPVRELERIYLDQWDEVSPGRGFTKPGRQILHCTFGSVLTDSKLGSEVLDLVAGEPETYRQILAGHFARHLAALRIGL